METTVVPEWLYWLIPQDALARTVVAVALAVIVVALLGRAWQRRREQRLAARRSAELRRTYGVLQMQQQEIAKLATRILATSSTGTIAGFEVVRQIEAVFADGQRSPAAAVELLKALAAQRGANALIHLKGQRLPDGKCVASGDAVIVQTTQSDKPSASAPVLPSVEHKPPADVPPAPPPELP